MTIVAILVLTYLWLIYITGESQMINWKATCWKVHLKTPSTLHHKFFDLATGTQNDTVVIRQSILNKLLLFRSESLGNFRPSATNKAGSHSAGLKRVVTKQAMCPLHKMTVSN